MTVTIDPFHEVGVYAYQGWTFRIAFLPRGPWDNASVDSCPIGPVLTAQEDLLSPSALCAHHRPPTCLRPRRGPAVVDIGLRSCSTSPLLDPQPRGPCSMRLPRQLEVIGTFYGPQCAFKHHEITVCTVTVRIDPLHKVGVCA